jgi:hypothetical protein
LTAKVLPGNKIELQAPDLLEGQTVEVIIILPEAQNSISSAKPADDNDSLSLEKRKAFLKLPLAERRRIMEAQADTMLSHYQENSEWRSLLSTSHRDCNYKLCAATV